jgi:hypothetical protein
MTIRGWTFLALLGCAALWSADAPTARAEDPVEAQRPTTLRCDVRVARVSLPAKAVESPPVLPGTSDLGVSAAPWSELLAALQKRGTTQVVMDRNTTTLPGIPCTLVQTQIWNVMLTRRADATNAYHEASPVKVGAEVQLTAQGAAAGAALEYEIKVDWIAESGGESPRQEHASWRGAHALEGAGTLVLRHAQQDDPNHGTEIYVFVSWRR